VLIKSVVRFKDLLTKIHRSKSGLWFPEFDLLLPRHQNVLAALGTVEGLRIIPASNIVTTAGDVFYAARMAGGTPVNTFTTHQLASAGTPAKGANRSAFTVIAASLKVQDAGYPMVSDADADNTGGGATIRTTRVSYTKADFSANSITHGIITNPTPGASEPLLTGYAFAQAFDKTANDTLKLFVNHEALGV
jgi:hypothetical protein